MKKKGAEKYHIIIALILGIILLSLVFMLIFPEYLEDEYDWEVCRTSIVLRDSLPEKDLYLAVTSAKEAFDLKCKTEVVNIDYENNTKAELEFSDQLAQCWHLVGRGNYRIFPTSQIFTHKSPCMVCARIHVDEDVMDYYIENPISFSRALDSRFSEKYTYFESMGVGDVNAFQYFKGWKDDFEIDYQYHLFDAGDTDAGFYYPEFYYPGMGDIFVIVSYPTRREGYVKPFMIFLQSGDESNLGKILDESWVEYQGGIDFQVCNSIETIPA